MYCKPANMCIRLYFCTLFGVVLARNYLEDRKNIIPRVHLTKIPKEFELKGENADLQFQKYVLDIHSLAQRHNLTVKYKVKVETIKPTNRSSKKMKKIRSKKYKIPLKKKSMKLSSRELMQRRLLEIREAKTEKIIMTTQKKPVIVTTKPPHSGKYRPIINAVKTKFTKKIRPVKSKIVTLA